MKRLHYGFTLIELMIVVAIIGILVAVGMPQYQNYIARAQVAEGLSLASGAKTAVVEYYDSNGSFPSGCSIGFDICNTQLGLPEHTSITGKYVKHVTVAGSSGIIGLQFKDAPDAHTLIATKSFYMIPEDEGGSISWRCQCASSDDGGCVNGGTPETGDNKRQIHEKYLPSSCL